MKKFKILITFVFAAMLFGCSEDENNSLDVLPNAAAPANLSALFTITQDNTGLVTITPRGEGVIKYDVYYGDAQTFEPVTLTIGESTQHTYAEGVYDVRIVATGLNGKVTEITQQLTVSFRAPETVVPVITPIPGNSLGINLEVTAEFETYFEVMFGEDPAQQPIRFMEGEVITHTYAAAGVYTVTITAYSGGVATTTVTKEVTITNPLLLPITFENPTLNYEFTDFNGNVSAVVDNPDRSGINTSAKVGKMTPAPSQWTGGYLTLGSPVDLSVNHFFKVKVWSPQAGVPVLLKLENLTDPNVVKEAQTVTTVANQWQELVFDVTGATQEYSKIVLFFNAANAGTGDTYYFDDIQTFNGTEAVELPLDFEGTETYVWNNFGGAVGSRVANPNVGGINTSANVGKFVKGPPEVWAGVAIPMDAVIDFSGMQKVKMKVWSPRAGLPVLMKFENMNPHNAGQDIERQVQTTVANQWEELTFDFTGITNANNYQQIVLFFNYNVAGTGETYYFDDIHLSN